MPKVYLPKKEIDTLLKGMTIICDTREVVNHHIKEYLHKKNVNHIDRKLDIGDYSMMVGDMTFENSVVIERKANIDEIAGNFTADRTRFENEFLRAKANNTKVFLLIENCSWQDIKSHNYRSKMKPSALEASLLSWQVRYNITVMFCIPELSGEIIANTLYYWARENL